MKKVLGIFLALAMLLSLSSAFADEYEGTLRMMGPGLFNDVGPDGVTDFLTGRSKPGYNELIAMFNEEYPNVKVEIEAIPWDSWQAKVQAAVAAEQTDIVLHGASTTDIVADLTDYLANDAELAAVMTATDTRRADPENYDTLKLTGIPYSVSPYYAAIDKTILANYGIELPSDKWTWDDVLEIAQKTTGIDPVTGKQTYGLKCFASNDSNLWKSYMCYCFARGVENFTMAKNKLDVTVHFTEEKNVAAFAFMKQIMDCAPAGFLEGSGGELFGQEGNDLAILFAEGPQWKYNEMVSYGTQDNYLFLPMPVQETGLATNCGVPGDNNMAIAVNAARPDLAWLFIHWMNTSEKALDWIIRTDSAPASSIGQNMMDKNVPYYSVIEETMGGYPENFWYAGSEFWDNTYGNSNTVLCSNLASLYSGEITPEECAANVQAGIEEWQALNK